MADAGGETRLIANAAERGNPGAPVLLALDYLHGNGGVARDEHQAAYWFETAAHGVTPTPRPCLPISMPRAAARRRA